MINNLDVSAKWEDKEWLQTKSALVPMRVQPLHNGHLNLLVNLADRFGKVYVLLSQHVGGEDDPYPSELRKMWLLKGIDIYTIPNTKISEKGSSRLPTIDEQKRSYEEIVKDNELVFVSGNPEIIERCISWYQFHFLDLSKITLERKVDKMDDDLLKNIEGNARIIRKAVQQTLKVRPGFLPEFISPEDLKLT